MKENFNLSDLSVRCSGQTGARMKKYMVAKYIRLSMEDLDLCNSEEKAESVSISNQRNFIDTFIEQGEEFQGAEIKEFVDDGYSGTNFDRPAIKELLRSCRQGEIDCIIVKDLSRFGRNYLEVGDYLEQIFPFLGVRFISINDGFDSKNFFGQTGGMDVAFKNFIYEMYSRDLSEKVKSGVTTCMKRGEYYAGCMVYGYQKSSDGKRMEVDEGAAVTIRRIFQELADGKDAKTLAIELNAEGVPTRLTYKQAKGEQLNRHYKADIWNRNKIHSIIHNRVYQGDMVYRKAIRTQIGCKQKVRQPEEKWLVIPDHHEAIVSRELFKKANDSIRKGKIAVYDRSAVRRGIVFCGCCGNRLELRKTKIPYYLCKRRNLLDNAKCNEIRMEKEQIEQTIRTIWQEHCRLFATIPVSELFEKQQEKSKQQENRLKQSLERFPAEKIKLYERFRSGMVKQDVFLKEKEQLSRQEEVVRRQIEKVSEQIDIYWMEWRDNNEIALGINGKENVRMRTDGSYTGVANGTASWNSSTHWPFTDKYNTEGLHLLLTFAGCNEWALGDAAAEQAAKDGSWANDFKYISYQESKSSNDTPRMEIDWIRFYKKPTYDYFGSGTPTRNKPMY